MPKFKITFKHTVVETYTTIIEADNEREALELFDESPFEEHCEEIEEQGLDIEVVSTEEIIAPEDKYIENRLGKGVLEQIEETMKDSNYTSLDSLEKEESIEFVKKALTPKSKEDYKLFEPDSMEIPRQELDKFEQLPPKEK